MICIGFSDVVFSQNFWDELRTIVDTIVDTVGGYLIIYSAEILIIILLSVIFSTLFIFCCITFASIITKKAKVLVAIGIYYVANGIFSFVGQIFYLFGISSLTNWISALPVDRIYTLVALILLGLISFFGVLCALLYTLQYWMIDRKLNLD